MSGESDMREMIKRLRTLPGTIAAAAPACAEALDGAIKASLQAGRGPSGEAWPATKEGHRPLPKAAGEATVTKAVGTTLITRAQFPYVFHQGGARGGALPARPTVPTALTGNLAGAIGKALDAAYQRHMRGERA